MVLEKYTVGAYHVAIHLIPRCLLRCWRVSIKTKHGFEHLGGVMHPPTHEMCQAIQHIYRNRKPVA